MLGVSEYGEMVVRVQVELAWMVRLGLGPVHVSLGWRALGRWSVSRIEEMYSGFLTTTVSSCSKHGGRDSPSRGHGRDHADSLESCAWRQPDPDEVSTLSRTSIAVANARDL